MTTLTMIKQAQQQHQLIQQSTNTLIKFATDNNTTLTNIVEDVNDVLANFSINLSNGKGLHTMGDNPLNYAYFLAGLESVLLKLTDEKNPVSKDKVINTIRRLVGLAITKHGQMYTANDNCRPFVEFGAAPENAKLSQKYMQLLSDSKKNPTSLINAIGQLKLAVGKIRTSGSTLNTTDSINNPQPV